MEMLCVWQQNARTLELTASMLVGVSGPPTRLIVLPPVVGIRYAPRNNSAMNTNLTYFFSPQVYSCEYQQTAQDVLNLCLNFDMDQIPFWPAPAEAAGGCSCNIGDVARKEVQISAQLTECSNNKTNLNKMTEVGDMTNYAQACICCAESAIISAYV
jgi:hypothetical protein